MTRDEFKKRLRTVLSTKLITPGAPTTYANDVHDAIAILESEFAQVPTGVVLSNPVMQDLLEKCHAVLETKGPDYTAGQQDTDRLYNFRKSAQDLDLTMPQVWSVLFNKHYMAVMKYARTGKVESEPIEGRLVDLINYVLLLRLIVRELATGKAA